jgi:hypothetical protein
VRRKQKPPDKKSEPIPKQKGGRQQG